jgi:bacillithiol biosynthesis cysteine-adding enzyme BshC
MSGEAPESWYPKRPASAAAWRARVEQVRSTVDRGWLDAVLPAIRPAGLALDRLTQVVNNGGVVVTTGQQPGLFGGPIYTWSKALTVRAFADELEAATGIPVAPLFWAATDDSDFAEASWTAVHVTGGYERLETKAPDDSQNASMSVVPLGDTGAALAALERACGSATDQRALSAVRRAYQPGQTIGGAYLELLRDLLEPLGIPVLDASHASVRLAAHQLLNRALQSAGKIHDALAIRARELTGAGFEQQVADVEGLSLVFSNDAGRRTRIALDSALSVREAGTLSPNVLLRPVIERALLPTVAYAAGPGEFAYFAQVSAVAEALDAHRPLAIPRWSVTLIEPHIQELLTRYGLSVEDVSQGDRLATRLLQQAIPRSIGERVEAMERDLRSHASSLKQAVNGEQNLVPERSVEAIERALAWRLERFNRRLRSGVRRRDTLLAADIGSLGGALFPSGVRQERMLNLIPFLAKYGCSVLERMLDAAREHARGLVRPGT